jgi:2-polyprenyl-6-methoxyphenol hydroxylase-like FAD-dependent oxidoreductase
MRTDVAIIGAGPAGLLLAHLLAQDGIESVVIESRTREYVAARIRAGILESSSVDLLRSVGLGAEVEAHGDEHRGIYLQVPNGTDVADWPDDRIWAALATRLGHGQDGWQLTPGPVTDKSVLPMRSFVQSPMRHGRLFLAGDAAHTVPPTGAKGLNLAIADVTLLAPALGQLVRKNDTALTDAYSDTALRRVWRCEHFSWWMTSMLHISGDPFDAQLQLSQLRWVTSSAAGAAGLAENYAGLPIGF